MNLDRNEPNLNYQPIFVARQPVFGQDHEIWGYELLFRHSDLAPAAQVSDQVIATAKVIADGFTIATTGIDHDKKFLINFPSQFLLQETVFSLPKEICIIEILETVQPTPEIIAACKKIKKDGYILALDDFIGSPGLEPLLELADIVKIDVVDMKPSEIIKIYQNLRRYKCKLLAEKIEDRETYKLTRSLGFSYFQGYFFSRPEIMEGRKISTANISKMQLLKELADEDFDVKKLADIISSDISFSYRLLKLINSSFYALREKIQSITQAITLMGSNSLRQWLTVVILSDLDHRPHAQELVFNAVCRGRFLELITETNLAIHYRKETMFLLGLFSNLDALLGQSMVEVMKNIPINTAIKSALCGLKNDANEWLTFAVAIDSGDWKLVEKLIKKHRLNSPNISELHIKAKTWTATILGRNSNRTQKSHEN